MKELVISAAEHTFECVNLLAKRRGTKRPITHTKIRYKNAILEVWVLVGKEWRCYFNSGILEGIVKHFSENLLKDSYRNDEDFMRYVNEDNVRPHQLKRPMPQTEYLTEDDVLEISRWLRKVRAKRRSKKVLDRLTRRGPSALDGLLDAETAELPDDIIPSE